MSTRKELQEHYAMLAAELDALRSARKNQFDSMLRDAEKKINSFLDLFYATPLPLLRESATAAYNALLAERERLALNGVGAPYPLGTTLKKTRHTGGTWGRAEKIQHGLLEAVTQKTKWQDNLGSWQRPQVGDYIVRYLKSDGAPSIRIDPSPSFSSWDWTPVDPAVQPYKHSKLVLE